ncbi:hypothetical protein [Rubellimicrobium roseum]|uniref:hypothetical protein n=1 Tax=Rubellimicrobium roseum TaxID=687525 RepID=UPI00159B8A63|nr:hypothetical protein [Rubellimicrobium roseum]
MRRWRLLWRELVREAAQVSGPERALLLPTGLVALYGLAQIPRRVTDVARLLGW